MKVFSAGPRDETAEGKFGDVFSTALGEKI
jgi:hypothetical protein